MSKILIFSDLHGGIDICNKGRKGINTHGSQYLRFLQGIRDLAVSEKVHAIANMGDLASGNNSLEFLKNHRIIRGILDKMTVIPIYHLFGNHEEGKVEDHSQRANVIMQREGCQYFIVEDTKHILLDIEFGKESGKIPESSLEFLEAEISNFDGDIYVYHHYPVTESPENTTYYHERAPKRAFSESSEAIKEILGGNNNIRMYFSGHTHKEYYEKIGGVGHKTIPGISEDRNGVPDGRVGILDTVTGELKLISVL